MDQGKSRVNRQALKGADQKKYQMHDIIRSASLTAKNWKQFEKQLASKGIEMQFKYAGDSRIIQGVSFKMGDYLFKGSEIDRNFSFGKLDKILDTNASVQQVSQDKWTSEGQSTSFADQLESSIGEQTNNESMLDMLLDAELSIAPDPEPFWLKKKKKAESIRR